MLSSLLGGIGLFLVGMLLMTDGLKAAAGDGLRTALVRFTGGPFRSLAAGAGVTALVQSSSATTLTTIGFVSAGLLTFPQAVGVIFGANLGTTSTGWLVAVFGLKMSVLPAALPMVGAGALLRLFGRGRLAGAGTALAGFGLIFVGIDTLQAGMTGLATRFSPESFPPPTLWGRLLLVLIGTVMTVVMQSSSAAVATTLTALSTGTIDLSQGAALVIGQNVGTTVTAGVAAIGASVPAQRTALAHVLFNLLTAVVAFLLLPVFITAGEWFASHTDGANEAIALAGFQTGFNLLGVAMLLPFTGPFSRMVTRLVPDRGPQLTRYLDRSVARMPSIALEATHRSLRDVLGAATDAVDPAVAAPSATQLAGLEAALDEIRAFLAEIRSEPESEVAHRRHVAALHAVDHLEQLVGLARMAPQRTTAGAHHALAGQREAFAASVRAVRDWLDGAALDAGGETARALEELRALALEDRARAIEAAASGREDQRDTLRRLEGLRWLDAAAHHLHRAVWHLAAGLGAAAPPAGAPLGTVG